jgi:hypothetical protein
MSLTFQPAPGKAFSVLSALFFLSACDIVGGDSSSGEDKDQRIVGKMYAIENTAEDAYDAAIAGDNRKVESLAGELYRQWRDVRPEVAGRNVPDEDLKTMDHILSRLRAISRDPPSTTCLARRSNAIIGIISGMLLDFKPDMPREIFQLDYVLRELVVNGQTSNFSQARARVEKLNEIWSHDVRQAAIKAGDGGYALAFDRTIARLDRFIVDENARATINESKNGMDILDAIKDGFQGDDDMPSASTNLNPTSKVSSERIAP